MRHTLYDRPTLEDDLRQKVETHIQDFLKNSVEPLDSSSLSRVKILDFIQTRDKALARKKRSQVEKAIDFVCCAMEAHVIEDLTKESTDTDLGYDNNVHMTDDLTYVHPNGATSESRSALHETKSTSTQSLAKRRDRDQDKEHKPKRSKVDVNRIPPKNISLSDIGGASKCIAQVLETIVMPLTHPEVYIHTGVPTPRGVLLHGPPGCGKTLLANAIAGEVGVPFISISAPSIVSGMSGESEKKVREIFEEARILAPCLLFFDEIDAVTPKRESAQREMERRIVAQFLTCMDDLSLEKTDGKPVLIIGATNRPDSLDPALRRAGRFDREVCMGVPDESARASILEVLCRKLTLSGTINMNQLAKMTPGFVGADLSALTSAAGVMAIKRIFKEMRTSQNSASNDDSTKLTDLPLSNGSEAVIALTQNDTETSAIRDFLDSHPEPLTEAALAPLAIEYSDFLGALPSIQPSSKREGFTTVPDVTWQDIGALKSIRAELQMAIVQPIKRPALFRSVGITTPAGVLLWGPPGCGKTLLAKAVANESKANFISIRGPELLNKYVGESERAVRQVFLRARASAPCIIFFDELDALVPRRDDSLSESSARVVNTLLTELDGLGDRTGVFVVGATNRPDMIDPAMLRPGRLDKPLFVQLPSPTERGEIIVTLTKGLPLTPGIDLIGIAAHHKCDNFSGADMAALVREAAVSALRSAVLHDSYEEEPSEGDNVDRIIQIESNDFWKAFDKVKPSVSDLQRAKYEKLLCRYNF